MKEDLKALNINSVQVVAEELMLKKGWTTTLEVKEQLRKDGFYAIQVEVSSAMDFLAWENKWCYDCNGKYRVYQFGEDTDLSFYAFMERGAQIWEVAVKENIQIIRVGKQQQKASIARHQFDSNRQALTEAARMIELRVREGFTIRAKEERYTALLLDYFEFLTKPVLQCTLYYHSVQKVERQGVRLNFNGIPQVGYVDTVKQAGYEFTFDFNESTVAKAFRSILEHRQWKAPRMAGCSNFLLGEKEIRRDVKLMTGEPVMDGAIQQYTTCKQIEKIEVQNHCLYRLDIQYKDGTKLVIRRDELEKKEDLWDLAKCLLRIV